MNLKRSSMFLLWVGAAISVSEMFTGGLLAPLGLGRGIAVTLIGHGIGTALFAGGSYVSYRRNVNAMDSVAFSFGRVGGKLVALCNLIQLIGWITILVVQAGSAIAGVFPALPFWTVTLSLSLLQILWAVIFGSPGSRINDSAVVLLAGLCVVLLAESLGYGSRPVSVSGDMSVMLGIELSIAMPVSWLPLAGDYGCKANDKVCAVGMPFLGYFLGSSFMYIIGLCIGVSTGSDIFTFIASSRFRYAACGIVLLSTITTNFVALYSAAVSATQWIKHTPIRIPIIGIGVFVLLVSVFFPVEQFTLILEKFLTAITMVFVPIFTLVLLDFFTFLNRKNFLTQKEAFKNPIHWSRIGFVIIGMAGNWLFTRYAVGIPTVLTVLLVSVLFFGSRRRGPTKSKASSPGPD